MINSRLLILFHLNAQHQLTPLCYSISRAFWLDYYMQNSNCAVICSSSNAIAEQGDLVWQYLMQLSMVLADDIPRMASTHLSPAVQKHPQGPSSSAKVKVKASQFNCESKDAVSASGIKQ
mmetsp:Transcript_4326/g.7959  ORF Transcript_4326/g.7959 Transcript_4326/m.7959 type:complete len:120 (+) Transcript_4326:264-623(+)